MNIPSAIKRQFKSANILSLLVGIVLIVVIGLYGHFIHVASATGTPEKFLTDLNGSKTSTLKINEEGILDLRVYGEGGQNQSIKNDLIFALDNSSAMQTAITGSATTKLADAKVAIKSFISKIDVSSSYQVGLVTYHANETTKIGAAETINLTSIATSGDKTNISAQVDNIVVPSAGQRANGIGAGIKAANDELLSQRARSDAKKTIILLSVSPEVSTPYLAGGSSPFESYFVKDMQDVNLAPIVGSELDRSISNQIKHFSIFYSNDSNVIGSSGGALTRFVAAKTNEISLPSGFAWDGNYNQTNQIGLGNTVDNNYFFDLQSPTDLMTIYSNIFYRVDLNGGAKLNIIEKLADNVQYEQTISAIDKGGRSYAVAGSSLGVNQYKFTLESLPAQYICLDTETDCLKAATPITSGANNGKFQITGNYVDLKLKIIGKTTGSFDLDSNFGGCQGGTLTKVAHDSRVEYIDPKSNIMFQSFDFPVLCIAVSQGNPKILKTIYKVSADSPPILTEGASFEAGDQVDVKIEIDEPDEFRTDYRIEDTLPPLVKGSIKYSLTLPSGQKTDNLDPSINGNKIIFIGSNQAILQRGKNYIEYRFRI